MAIGSNAAHVGATKTVCFRSAIGKRAVTRLLGTDMLEIQYDGDSRVLVSPRDEDAFLAAIGQSALGHT